MNGREADTLRESVIAYCEGRATIGPVAELLKQRTEGSISDGPDGRLAIALNMAYAARAQTTKDGATRQPPERTPETVLRAMLKAYEAAALTQALASVGAQDEIPKLWRAEDLVDHVRVTLAHCIANGGTFPGADDSVERDYETRLSGARPLDATPLDQP